MKKARSVAQFVRATLVGGVIFLVPVLVIAVLLRHGIKLATKLAAPLLKHMPDLIGGILVADLVAATLLLLLAFAAGLFARTNPGQSMIQWVENSLIGSLPQFNFVRGVAEGVGGSDDRHVDVVLVPTDAGLNLAFVFEPSDAPWVAVFIPGAPDWRAGGVAFVERANMQPAGIGFIEAIKVLRKLGSGAHKVIATLERGPA
ncbi:hypothetical protein EUV02_12290 [Polymorphobacter arshaanensis]|uniref:DUF502 domain-containing protein n=1 Tax=Glacieibacterium arshaanense TaxID=2511025 RepID=A0A4Y9EKI4_9SPHN|nr:hypothetical protein [Polymorphobacter arshaanensis]TFU01087.1 hypothetical protein EUV02_12290 [Polymorphobacter arshaanensis]